jgi:hypothetical protein
MARNLNARGKPYTYTTQRALRVTFRGWWRARVAKAPELATDAPARRESFNLWIDQLQRADEISDALAQRATLED